MLCSFVCFIRTKSFSFLRSILIIDIDFDFVESSFQFYKVNWSKWRPLLESKDKLGEKKLDWHSGSKVDFVQV